MPVTKMTWQQDNGSARICNNSTSIQCQAATVAQLHTQEHSQSRPTKSRQNTEMAQLHSTSYYFPVLSSLLQLATSLSQNLNNNKTLFFISAINLMTAESWDWLQKCKELSQRWKDRQGVWSAWPNNYKQSAYLHGTPTIKFQQTKELINAQNT